MSLLLSLPCQPVSIQHDRLTGQSTYYYYCLTFVPGWLTKQSRYQSQEEGVVGDVFPGYHDKERCQHIQNQTVGRV